MHHDRNVANLILIKISYAICVSLDFELMSCQLSQYELDRSTKRILRGEVLTMHEWPIPVHNNSIGKMWFWMISCPITQSFVRLSIPLASMRQLQEQLHLPHCNSYEKMKAKTVQLLYIYGVNTHRLPNDDRQTCRAADSEIDGPANVEGNTNT